MFIKRKEADQHGKGSTLHVKLDQTIDEKFKKQIEMLGLTIDDLYYLKAFKPTVDAHIDEIVDSFYRTLGMESSLTKIINDNSSIDRLKVTLRKHICEMFDGVIDSTYFEKRKKIAEVHVRIGLKTQYYIGAFQTLFIDFMGLIQKNLSKSEEQFTTLKAVSRILCFEQQLVLEAFETVIDEMKNKIEEEKRYLAQSIIESSESLAAISEQTNAAFHQLTSQSEEMITYAKKAIQISNLATLQATEGKTQLNQQTSSMTDISHSVGHIALEIEELGEISNEMEGIMDIVTHIASQTNLLSLNAAIEAARAGEAGKGFGVVAGEVRKLSDQTKESAANVAELLRNTHIKTNRLMESLKQIQTAVTTGESSMNETEQHFIQIVKAMLETKQQNTLMEQEVEQISEVISELGMAFDEVTRSADALAIVAQDLK